MTEHNRVLGKLHKLSAVITDGIPTVIIRIDHDLPAKLTNERFLSRRSSHTGGIRIAASQRHGRTYRPTHRSLRSRLIDRHVDRAHIPYLVKLGNYGAELRRNAAERRGRAARANRKRFAVRNIHATCNRAKLRGHKRQRIFHYARADRKRRQT